MARYTGPKTRIARKFGEPIFGEDKVLAKKNYAPGQHGQNRRRKTSEYGTQLREKQKAKYTYGVLEKYFRNLFDKAARTKGITGEVLLQLLESRLDNVVYRLGFANSRRQARQLVNHGHFTVNGGRVNIPSYLIKAGDVIAVSEKATSNAFFKKLKEDDAFVAAPKWLDRDKNTLQGKVIAMPTKADIDFDIAVHLIVELYSK